MRQLGGFGTDAVTVAYLDATWPINNLSLTALAVDGSSITVNIGTFDGSGKRGLRRLSARTYQDSTLGTKVGDVSDAHQYKRYGAGNSNRR